MFNPNSSKMGIVSIFDGLIVIYLYINILTCLEFWTGALSHVKYVKKVYVFLTLFT